MVTLLRVLFLICGLLSGSLAALANPCSTGGASGMGGTGLAPDGSGIGGTGKPQAGAYGQDGGTGMGGTGLSPDGSGMGGTGRQAEGTGMGGTGRQAEGTGMGGTGRQADGSGMGGTGVVGIITGFGSICVNGIEVHYGLATPVSLDGQPLSPRGLAIGQLVSVDAVGQGDSLQARRIAVHSALVGPVSWVSPAGDALVALGQKVRIKHGASPVAPMIAAGLKKGDFIQVSGLRDASGEVLATRVERVRPDLPVSVSGPMQVLTGQQGRIGGLAISGMVKPLKAQQVRVVGKLVAGVLKAERIVPAPEAAALAKAERVVLQGPVVVRPKGAVVDLGYARVSVPAAALKGVQAGEWLRVEAVRRPDGGFEAREIERDGPRGGREDARKIPSKQETGAAARTPERNAREAESARDGSAGAGAERREPAEREERTGESRREATPERHARTSSVEHEERPRQEERSKEEGRSKPIERPERISVVKPEPIERPPQVEKPEPVERPPQIEKPEPVERPPKVDKPERVEKPEKPEKPEKQEKVEKPEKIEKPEPPEHH